MRELPIACTLDASGMEERGKRWRALGERALISRERRPTGATLRFRDTDGVAGEVRELVRLEGECCPFLDMRLDSGDDEIVQTIEGPPEAADLLDAFGGAPAPAR